MNRIALFAVFLAPLAVRAQEKAVEVAPIATITPAPTAAPIAAPLTSLAAPLAAPALPLGALTAPSAAAAPAASVPSAAAPAAVSAAASDVPPAPTARADATRPAAAPRSLRAAAARSGDGRALFDGGAFSGTSPAGAPSSDEAPRLAAASARAAAPARAPARVPLKERAGDVAEVGLVAAGFQLLTGIAFLVLGAQAAFPPLAGVLWGWGGAEMIHGLGKVRATIVGGWQASHDQKMRTDYMTGKLVDIRGHKYGEDRYDVWANGPVSARERNAIDAAAVALGLPWVWAAGPKGVALYAAAALATIALRRLWRRKHPEAPPAASNTEFEYDR